MHLVPIITGPLQEICYLLWNDPQQAVVVDPGAEADCIQKVIDEHQLTVTAYVCTHGHTDHIGALADLHATQPAPIFMHSEDLSWAFGPLNHLSPIHDIPREPVDATFYPLENIDETVWIGPHMKCLETPGHTPGSCSLFFPESNILISGDTLFKGSCGRTDLPGGNPHQLKSSLRLLEQLPDETRVYPGHGRDTTIKIECATNFYFR